MKLMCLVFEKEIDSILEERKNKADQFITHLGRCAKKLANAKEKPLC